METRRRIISVKSRFIAKGGRSAKDGPHASGFLAPALLLLLAAAPVCRAFFGIDWTDESYYAALAYRFCLGDQLFANSWDIHQLSALFSAPLVFLYTRLARGTEGLVLFLRLAFVLFQYGTAVFLFYSLRRRFSACAAWLCAGLTLLFSHFALSAFSYNTLALGFLVWSFAFFVRAEDGVRPRSALFFAGLFYAFAVQSYPQLALTLPLPLLNCAFFDRAARRAAQTRPRGTLCFACGIFCALLLFCGAVMVNASFGALLDNLSFLLSDPEHPMGDYLHKLGNYLHVLFIIFRPEAVAVLLLTPAAALCKRLNAFEKRPSLRPAFLAALLAAGLAGLVCAACYEAEASVKLNYLAMPLGLLYPALWLLSDDRPKAPLLLFCMGAVFSVTVHLFSSNMLIRASSYPLLLCSVASVLQCDALMRRAAFCARSGRALRALALLTGLAALTLFGFFRVTGMHREGALSTLDTCLMDGPAKGIYTTAESAARYRELSGELAALAPAEGNLLITAESPLGYLFTKLRPASPSVWRTRLSSERLLQYYALHPERIPDVIAVGADDTESLANPGAFFDALPDNGGYTAYEGGYYLLYIKNG